MSRARVAFDSAVFGHLRPSQSTRKLIKYVLVIALVVIGLTLPSVPPAGRSVLVWLQREVIRLTAVSDIWREEQAPSKPGAKGAAGVAGSVAANKASAPGGAPLKECHGGEDVLARVPHREHYQVLSECITVFGTILSEPHSDPDGVAFDFIPEPHDAHLFAADESEVETGQLHKPPKPVVGLGLIVPADLPGCKPGGVVKWSHLEQANIGICSGLDVVVPPPGTKVKITGAFVFDRDNKLHLVCPVWSITAISD